ncbi:metal-dependent hydrolase [Lacibacterium aquatile]|uniref:Metal-dependent hydrolase n=1 Tax=Lacibacterium aquatile TaxID=1168082 RepID=A0ABW5DSP3_9PROT
MDSLTQVALGAAIGVATLGRRTKPWKAALVGALAGTVPDLDAFIDHGDPISNMTFHRAESHAFFYLTLIAPVLAWLAAMVFRDQQNFKRWWLAVWLALVTHPLLDYFTIYGTQLALPFTDTPFGLGSIFIIDLAYTIPLLVGVIVAISRARHQGLSWNKAGLILSSLYLCWSAYAQNHVAGIAEASLRERGFQADQILVTPSPFNTILWRVVAVSGTDYAQGFYSFFDDKPQIVFETHPRQTELLASLKDDWPTQRIVWFTHGFYKMSQRGDRIIITDLRMGQEPHYNFNFEVASDQSGTVTPIPPHRLSERPDLGAGLSWLWQRLKGNQISAPGL